MEQQFLKIVCMVVAIEKEGDTIKGEIKSAPIDCYSLEEVATVFSEAHVKIAEFNAANKGNRSQRRKSS